jgi:hypothetical protein
MGGGGGEIRDESDLLHMYVRGAVMIGVFTCRIFIGIPPYPWEFLDFSDLIIFSISLGVAYFSFWTGERKVFMKTVNGIVII